MIAPPLRASVILPNCESLTHFSKLWSPVRPRVRVISAAFQRPGSFLITNLPSGPFCLSSTTSCSILSPDTSVMLLIVMPSNSRPKEWPTELSLSGSAMMYLPPGWSEPALLRRVHVQGLLGDEAGATGELRQPEDDELGRLHRRDSDLADHLTGVDTLGRVGFPVT